MSLFPVIPDPFYFIFFFFVNEDLLIQYRVPYFKEQHINLVPPPDIIENVVNHLSFW